jgi:hypothetical protein
MAFSGLESSSFGQLCHYYILEDVLGTGAGGREGKGSGEKKYEREREKMKGGSGIGGHR